MFTIASTAALAFMFSIWSRDGALNTTLKVLFLGLSLWGLAETMIYLGFAVPVIQ